MGVVDASVLITALADDGPDGERARTRLSGEDLAAPELVDLEVTSVLRRLVATRKLSAERAESALNDLLELAVRRCAHAPLLRPCWDLRLNVTVYDGAYVALAETLDAVLVTADARLAHAPGMTCVVEVLASSPG